MYYLLRSLDQVFEVLRHEFIYIVIEAVVHAVECRLAYRSYAPTHGNLFAPRGAFQSIKREMRFRALLSERGSELSLTTV